ncbi:unnamed protein product [Rotaria sp. Silwood1]|nr:unnamed protein product [Rotaria sp. Silwood1]
MTDKHNEAARTEHDENDWEDDLNFNLFTDKNTNIDIVKKNCEECHSQNSQHNCVLIMTGSLNPIHRSHISNLETVKKQLEQSNPSWHVLAGYLSPTQ